MNKRNARVAVALLFILIASILSGCVAPSMTIYRTGTNARGATAAVKAVQFYGDFDAGHTVSVSPGSVVIASQGPYMNSRTAAVNYRGMAAVSRATIQPIVWALVTSGLLGNVAGTAAGTVNP